MSSGLADEPKALTEHALQAVQRQVSKHQRTHTYLSEKEGRIIADYRSTLHLGMYPIGKARWKCGRCHWRNQKRAPVKSHMMSAPLSGGFCRLQARLST